MPHMLLRSGSHTIHDVTYAMKPFEYVIVIVSVIIGLTLTQFANVVSFMIKDYEISTFHLPYLAVLLLGFITALNYWAALYALRKRAHWNSLTMGVLSVSGLMIYAIAIVTSPPEQGFDHNYSTFYQAIILKTLILIIAFVSFLIIESFLLKRNRPFLWHIIMIGNIILTATGVFIDSDFYRNLLAFILLGLQVINVLVNKFEVTETDKTFT